MGTLDAWWCHAYYIVLELNNSEDSFRLHCTYMIDAGFTGTIAYWWSSWIARGTAVCNCQYLALSTRVKYVLMLVGQCSRGISTWWRKRIGDVRDADWPIDTRCIHGNPYLHCLIGTACCDASSCSAAGPLVHCGCPLWLHPHLRVRVMTWPRASWREVTACSSSPTLEIQYLGCAVWVHPAGKWDMPQMFQPWAFYDRVLSQWT